MNDLLLQGLTLSALGLGLTFAALGLFVLVILGLQRVFAARPAPAKPEAPILPPGAPLARDSEAEEIAAAICIALSHLRALEICESGLGDALEAGRGPWWRPADGAPPAPLRSRS